MNEAGVLATGDFSEISGPGRVASCRPWSLLSLFWLSGLS